jgi:hypothetical protein
VFDKTERAFFAGTDVPAVVRRLQSALHVAEVPTQQTAPASWVGRGVRTSWSIVPRVTMNAAPTPNGFMVEVRVSADVEPTGAIVLVVCWLFCFPAAILVAVLAHQDFTRRQAELFAGMLSEIGHLMIEPNFPPALGGFPPHRH